GVDWARVLGGGRVVDLPTYAFQRQRYYWLGQDGQSGVASGAAGSGGVAGSASEARFWAAIEAGDVARLEQTLAVDGQRPLRELLPALSSWRREERDRSVTGSWRYRISWVPVADPPPA